MSLDFKLRDLICPQCGLLGAVYRAGETTVDAKKRDFAPCVCPHIAFQYSANCCYMRNAFDIRHPSANIQDPLSSAHSLFRPNFDQNIQCRFLPQKRNIAHFLVVPCIGHVYCQKSAARIEIETWICVASLWWPSASGVLCQRRAPFCAG